MTNPIIYAVILLNDLKQPITETNLTDVLDAVGVDSMKFQSQIKVFITQTTTIDFATELSKVRAAQRERPQITSAKLPTTSSKEEPKEEAEKSDDYSIAGGLDKLFGN